MFKNFHFTSATLVSLVTVLGALGSALVGSTQPELVAAGAAVAGVYNIAHAALQVFAPLISQDVPSAQK